MKAYQEKTKKLEEILKQLREEASSCSDTTVLHKELKDLESLYNSGRSKLVDVNCLHK